MSWDTVRRISATAKKKQRSSIFNNRLPAPARAGAFSLGGGSGGGDLTAENGCAKIAVIIDSDGDRMQTTQARIYRDDKQRLMELRFRLSIEQNRIVTVAEAIRWLLAQPEAKKVLENEKIRAHR